MEKETMLDFQRRTAMAIEPILDALKSALDDSEEDYPRVIANY